MEETLSSRVVFKGQAVKLRVDSVRLPGGRQSEREIVEHGDCVVIIPIDAGGNLLLVKQFRKPVERELLEIPAGGIDPGEEPAAAVCREMREETGYRPQKIEKLGGFYASPGYCTEYMHLFLARDLVLDRLHAEDTDSIELVKVSLSQVAELIATGAICDAKSIAGLLIYLSWKQSATG